LLNQILRKPVMINGKPMIFLIVLSVSNTVPKTKGFLFRKPFGG
jgi:hypothetical protein